MAPKGANSFERGEEKKKIINKECLVFKNISPSSKRQHAGMIPLETSLHACSTYILSLDFTKGANIFGAHSMLPLISVTLIFSLAPQFTKRRRLLFNPLRTCVLVMTLILIIRTYVIILLYLLEERTETRSANTNK